MSTLIILAWITGCPNVAATFPDSLVWNPIDTQAAYQAGATCNRVKPHAPCLVKIRKIKELTYHAICGRKTDVK